MTGKYGLHGAHVVIGFVGLLRSEQKFHVTNT